ncbi:endo alpha-1,4 polygalactosaminidase [Oceanisphaera sp. IT1-181]|uniref:endo alpha-1,4 polygalactosaminidase n=1 Tax=Oceanisphaera sp. IT1-181 TaxID=3081199 RepID=UPI0029CA913C|nr:endo alpha-1,4 polygalactosaminidase [Oceanisphaera sp. IT1-181]
MRLLIWVLLLLPTLFIQVIGAERPAKSIAFYYDSIDSVRELMSYERVVVTPSLITERQIETLHKAGTQVFAYLSIGEYDEKILPESLSLLSPVQNTNWQSHVMDLSAIAWREHLLQRASQYVTKGFDGLFLDTLDSYYLFAEEEAAQAGQQQALARIIEELAGLNAKPKLILNRGFEVLEQVSDFAHAVVAESLYHGYDPINDSYREMSETDSEWLTNQLNRVKALNLEAIVIDYIPGNEREAQKVAAQRLLNEGYTPYISDGLLYQFGVSTIEPIARRVLGFFDSTQEDYTGSLCHRLGATSIEYLGYVPECLDVNTIDFARLDINRYAAIVAWLDESTYNQQPQLQAWLAQHLNVRPMLFLGDLPTLPALRAELGLQTAGDLQGKINISQGKDWLKSTNTIAFSEFETYSKWLSAKPEVEVLLGVTDDTADTAGLLFSAPWGGAALSPLPITTLANDKEVWLIDPFRLLEGILSLPAIPAADVTTETGRRILTSHVDGDGFPSKSWFPGKPYTAEVLMEHIFKPFNIPQTVSVIEGEVSKQGLYPEISAELETIARNIFSLPNIEVASHTFSHPFFWKSTTSIKEKKYGDNLPIPNYDVDFHKEIIGSVDYINQRLAPKDKKTNLILWSGGANPDEKTLGIAERANLLNVNGGNTNVVFGNSSLTQVSPTIAWYPTAVQVYAPVLNENVYTSEWTENFEGYRRVIETFELLGSPRRLKTIGIYYHMYSGTYPASLKAVKDVHAWAIQQKVTPLYLSEYAMRAKTLYETGLAHTLDGRWQITSSGIKSLRLPHRLGTPVMNKSTIAGWEDSEDGKYLFLSDARATLTLSDQKDRTVRLKNANGQLLKWQRLGNVIRWSILSHVPLEFELAHAAKCKQSGNTTLHQVSTVENTVRYTSEKAGLFSGELRC